MAFNYGGPRPNPVPEFGTNTGRQGIFDPEDEEQQSRAIQRLLELQDEYGDKLDPQYSGPTGLTSGDGIGFARMQNAATEALNIKRILGGQGPMQVEFGGVMPSRPMQGLRDTMQERLRRQATMNRQAAGGGYEREGEDGTERSTISVHPRTKTCNQKVSTLGC